MEDLFGDTALAKRVVWRVFFNEEKLPGFVLFAGSHGPGRSPHGNRCRVRETACLFCTTAGEISVLYNSQECAAIGNIDHAENRKGRKDWAWDR